MAITKNISFKNKCKLLEKMALEYDKAIYQIKVQNYSLRVEENEIKYHEEDTDYWQKYKDLIDGVLEMMPIDYRRIIKNDFLKNASSVSWWSNYYSRSTYYRHKHKAIDCFLQLCNIY